MSDSPRMFTAADIIADLDREEKVQEEAAQAEKTRQKALSADQLLEELAKERRINSELRKHNASVLAEVEKRSTSPAAAVTSDDSVQPKAPPKEEPIDLTKFFGPGSSGRLANEWALRDLEGYKAARAKARAKGIKGLS